MKGVDGRAGVSVVCYMGWNGRAAYQRVSSPPTTAYRASGGRRAALSDL